MDTKELLSGYEGKFFNEECLYPAANRYQCDIRTSDTFSEGLLDGTKSILLLGNRAFQEWTEGKYKNYTLHEQRGCPLETKFILDGPVTCSYFPRDCVDMVNWESRLNPLAEQYEESKAEEDETETKRKSKTQWKNFGFWLRQDTQKCLKAIGTNNGIWRPKLYDNYRIYPSSSEIIYELSSHENSSLYLDIETDSNLNILCIGISFDDSPVYVIPWIKSTDYKPAYSEIHKIYRGLCRAIKNNTVVIHNSMFDLMVLAWKYRIPFGRQNYDSMWAQHRCFPEIEKSLGHCVSMWTWEPYHKDEHIWEPQNSRQERQLWEYNGKDIYTMRLVHKAQIEYSKTVPGLRESIQQSNDMIYPYLLNTLLGIRYSQEKMDEIVKSNDRWMTQYLRIIRALIGEDTFKTLKGKSQANLCTSPKMAIEYFHDMLGYSVVKRTPDKKPSLDADAIYKLKLKYPDNPVLSLILRYREKSKETSMLKFNPFQLYA